MESKIFLEHRETDTPNIRLVKALYEAISEGDEEHIAATIRILSDQPVWNVCPGCVEGRVYSGLSEIFGDFYSTIGAKYFNYTLRAEAEVFIDGGDIVTVLGFYSFKVKRDGSISRVRFSHTWKMTPDNRIGGVWQVCDSYEMRKELGLV